MVWIRGSKVIGSQSPKLLTPDLVDSRDPPVNTLSSHLAATWSFSLWTLNCSDVFLCTVFAVLDSVYELVTSLSTVLEDFVVEFVSSLCPTFPCGVVCFPYLSGTPLFRRSSKF